MASFATTAAGITTSRRCVGIEMAQGIPKMAEKVSTRVLCLTHCLAGFKVVKKLPGLSTKDLIPVTLKMHAADNRDIKINHGPQAVREGSLW